ncbi:MAG: tRNA (adenosine(37)-N6)-dimethylallyltransferase MiaA, partial [Deltaproteobacteria bacterium]
MIDFPCKCPLIMLAGPTAAGKTALSIELAQRYQCEIISVDSMQIYRGMDIGTAKISRAEMGGIRHHLIDVADPGEPYNAGRFAADAVKAISEIIGRNKRILLTGGTGLYYQALLFGLAEEIPAFPEIRQELIEHYIASNKNSILHQELYLIDRISAEKIHKNDSQRLVRAMEIFLGTGQPWSQWLEQHKHNGQPERFTNTALICLDRDRDELYKRIDLRCRIMIESGLEQEVRGLLEQGYSLKNQSMRAIGYKHMVEYIHKKCTKDEMLLTMQRDTRRYAKR